MAAIMTIHLRPPINMPLELESSAFVKFEDTCMYVAIKYVARSWDVQFVEIKMCLFGLLMCMRSWKLSYRWI
jgi:hypothetical protein